MKKTAKIYVAGHLGMVGSAIIRTLEDQGYSNIMTRTSSEVDLRNQQTVNEFFGKERPEYVFLAAAKVGGILANDTYRAEFIYDNLMIASNVIHAAYEYDAAKLLFLSSSCVYPKLAPQPIKEEYLLSGELEPTNEPYAIAKIAGMKLCQAYWDQYGKKFISVMPSNLYGPNDNYDLHNSHVLPALIRKFYEAKINGANTVTIWGSGTPKREFLHVDDLADACVFLMKNYSDREIINVGMGNDVTILQLAETIGKIVGFEGRLVFDKSKPDGTPRKLLDVSKINSIGWKYSIGLEDGIEQTYRSFLQKALN